MKRHRVHWAVAAALGLALVSCSEPLSTAGRDTDSPKWLFVVQSDDEATFDADDERLTVPARTVTAFTDRPVRDARSMTAASFADLWDAVGPDSFSVDPPNAVLTYWTEADGGEAQTVVCELVGDVAAADDGTLSMGVRVLDPAGATLPAAMHRVSLFVDDLSCWTNRDDVMIIELYNMLLFEDAFEIIATPTIDGSTELELSCPDLEGHQLPEMELSMTLSNSALATSCTQAPAVIDAAALAASECTADSTCIFEVVLRNSMSGLELARTRVPVTIDGTRRQIIPELEPAELPPCAVPRATDVEFGPTPEQLRDEIL